MMPVLYLLVLVILAKIVLIDSPLARRSVSRTQAGAAASPGRGGIAVRAGAFVSRRGKDSRALGRVVEEQSFLIRGLSQPRRRRAGPADTEDPDTRT